MGIIQGLRKKEGRRSRGGAANTAPNTPKREVPETGASLMLMLPDAAGIAAYQLNQFASPKALEFFMDSTLRGIRPEGAVMFWALTWEPKGLADAEPLVLIRDGSTPVVYPFSFSDIDSAHDFVRHEMQRGLHLFQVMIYWAVPAKSEPDFWGRSTIVPAEAPRRPAIHAVPAPAGEISAAAPVVDVPSQVTLPQTQGSAEEDDSERFLQDDDIADAVRQANHIATRPLADVPEESANIVPMPVPAPGSRKSNKQPPPVDAEPIDFASASQKVEEGRAFRAAANAWANFGAALDEALDAYVARQVANKLAWNRISRALGHAIEAKRQADVLEAERRARGDAARAEQERLAAVRAEAEEAARIEKKRIAEAKAAAAEAARIAAEEAAAKLHALMLAWATGSTAIADSVHALRHDRMVRGAWEVGSAELARAAKSISKSKAMRKAWLNAAWTMEEAAYAYALEQKSRSIRAWRLATIGLAEAAAVSIARDRSIRRAWSNASLALGEAHRTHAAHLGMLKRSWSTGTRQIRIAVLTRQRMIRVRNGLDNFATALEAMFEAKAYREEMIAAWDAAIEGLIGAADAKHYHDRMAAAWGNAAFALEGVCRAYIRKQKRAIRAWGRLAMAFGAVLNAKFEQEAAIAAWKNISLAIEEAVFAKQRYIGLVSAWSIGSRVLADSARRKHRGLVFAWKSAGAVIAEAVVARKTYEAAVRAWTNAGIALAEATVARARYWCFVDAWDNAGYAIREAAKAYLAWKAGLEAAWQHLSCALFDAVNAMTFRDQSIAAWNNATLAIGEMAHAYRVRRQLARYWQNAGFALAEAVPVHLFKLQSIASWQTAALAFRQAIVVDAKIRIAVARLDRKQIAAIDKIVKSATARAATRPAGKGKGKQAAMAATLDAAPAVAPLSISSHVMLPDEYLPDDFEDDFDDLPNPVTGAEESMMAGSEAEREDRDGTSSAGEKTPLFPGLWRSRESRWRPREEPFRGFESPPGRFHHNDRERKPEVPIE